MLRLVSRPVHVLASYALFSPLSCKQMANCTNAKKNRNLLPIRSKIKSTIFAELLRTRDFLNSFTLSTHSKAEHGKQFKIHGYLRARVVFRVPGPLNSLMLLSGFIGCGYGTVCSVGNYQALDTACAVPPPPPLVSTTSV